MGILVLVILSFTFAWTVTTGSLGGYTGERPQIRRQWFESGRALKRFYEYAPPARKSVIVDINGMSHGSADGTHLTKRDRSKPFPRLDTVPRAEQGVAPASPVLTTTPQAPLYQGQIEETPLPVAQPPKPLFQIGNFFSLGRKVQTSLLADKSLSRSAQLTLKATSVKNRVTLRGIVLDQEEKDYIGAKAEQIAGAGNVDNRMTILYKQ